MEQALDAASRENPDFEKEMWETLAKDPTRLAHAKYMVQGTRFAERAATVQSSSDEVILTDVLGKH